jgi:hypothetical protein
MFAMAVVAFFVGHAATPAKAAPLSAAGASADHMARDFQQGLTTPVYHRRHHRYRGYHHRRHYGYRHGYRRHGYARPVGYYHRGYGSRVVCRIRHRQVWTPYGYRVRPVRVCARRW